MPDLTPAFASVAAFTAAVGGLAVLARVALWALGVEPEPADGGNPWKGKLGPIVATQLTGPVPAALRRYYHRSPN